MSSDAICVVIPTYNNERTLSGVIDAVLMSGLEVIVVNDGSTDRTSEVLKGYEGRVNLIQYNPNRGKGFALMQGFRRAADLGATYAISFDSDGQHEAEDISRFVKRVEHESNDTMIIGSRMLKLENMPLKNSFANRFSNFWFTLQTGLSIPDTQSGFRLYPLKKILRMRIFTHRYESELEMLVRLAWSGTKIVPLPITVYYTSDRVTHFRPTRDFLRISLLNAVLTLLSLVYGHPRMLIQKCLDK